jgi:pyruvate carboxylase
MPEVSVKPVELPARARLGAGAVMSEPGQAGGRHFHRMWGSRSMGITSLLIANRGEIAIRISRGAAEVGIRTVAVFSEDDARSLHTRRADDARALKGIGVAAYLDAEQLIAIAREAACDAIHPGYGFLAENAGFARQCADAGLIFVGPRPEILQALGDKVVARRMAREAGVPVLHATEHALSLEEAREFLASLDGRGMVLKAVAGGGGRGMRIVRDADEVEDAYARCQSEAKSAFGSADLYAEELIPRARHIEVQIGGDGSGRVTHLGERECTIQRRNQKVVEIAPSPSISAELRDAIVAAAVRLASSLEYDNIGTVEFLVDLDAEGRFAFIEANPRLQVEHTVTEEVTGIDLVELQLKLASGRSLDELELRQDAVPAPRGYAIQLRINAETFSPDGSPIPAGGTLAAFEAPSGPGIRVDSAGYAGYTTNPRFDPLLAKLVVHSPSPRFGDAVNRAYRALCEFRVDGVATNIPLLQNLLRHPDFAAGRISTRFMKSTSPSSCRSQWRIHDSSSRRWRSDQPGSSRARGSILRTRWRSCTTGNPRTRPLPR